jgi:hypothetical protein
MAQDNPDWGYTRIRDALANLGHEIARGTVRAILRAQGIDLAPERSRRTSWKAFPRSHWDAIAACDFSTSSCCWGEGHLRTSIREYVAHCDWGRRPGVSVVTTWQLRRSDAEVAGSLPPLLYPNNLS